MAKHWTKIRSDVVRSTRMASLLETNPLAYGLYMNAKAVCDDYGRLPADPKKFKALACPMSDITLKRIAAALDCMEQTNVIRRYEVDGDVYLEVISYNDIEQTDWACVGRSDYPTPPNWQPPASLVEFVSTRHTTDKRITPERYGLSEAMVPNYAPPTVHRPSTDRPPSVGRASESETESETYKNKTPPTPPVPGGATGSSLDGHGRRQRRQTAENLTPLERQALAGLKRDNQVATIEQVREFSALWMEYPDPDDPPIQFTDWHKQFRVWANDPNDRQFALDLRDLYELRERVKNRG